MRAIVAEPTEEGQDPKSAIDVVAEVLPKSKFLRNVGLEGVAPKKSATTAIQARVQELEAEVQAERQGAEALRCQIEYQQNRLEALASKFEESEAANKKQQEELESLKKQGEETNSILRRLLNLNKD
ncbi:unnamed protein product [Urochloa decumbens]|uniref:Uncharacterized protein n=1 Tax=Urochloa decumbens TaxID=240449 RepID=A0ABC9D076_9POAL